MQGDSSPHSNITEMPHCLALRRFSFILSILITFLALGFFQITTAQNLASIEFKTQESQVVGFTTTGGITLNISAEPLFSALINDSLVWSADLTEKAVFPSPLADKIKVNIEVVKDFEPGFKTLLTFQNNGQDTSTIENVVPFGQKSGHTHITASGPWSLTRTKLFRPGKSPVGVILPDNAWEMGYGAFQVGDKYSVTSIARRTDHQKAEISRWRTDLYPGGSVTYTFYADLYEGPWQNGLKLMFQDRYLYDLHEFDQSLYRRDDLKWIRDQYLIGLQMAWDRDFYNQRTGEYQLQSFLEKMEKLAGGWDIFGIWPTWPRLGIDQRNQWDLYRDLPGGLDKLAQLADTARKHGTRFFIAYNPWDKSTREENPHRAMASLIDQIDADGVVLDTRGKSSYKLQSAADSVRDGVIMYSEGMAVPKHMSGIVSGRVHNAIRMPPVLNLNKLIKPDFSIYRVGDPGDGPLRRGLSLSLFNGYGYEFNLFRPDRPSWLPKAYRYAGKIVRVLREHSPYFNSTQWTPLIDSPADSIWINQWPHPDHSTELFTIFNLQPEGYHGPLIPVDSLKSDQYHYVDIWNHRELTPDTTRKQPRLPAKLAAFDESWLNTRKEGSVAAIAKYRKLIKARLVVDSLYLHTDQGTEMKVWAGDPSYSNSRSFSLPARDTVVNVTDKLGFYEGKLVIQLLNRKGYVIDERTTHLSPGTPRLVRQPEKTRPAGEVPSGMKKVPAGTVSVQLSNRETFIPYPDSAYTTDRPVASFYMDVYPVTNADFKKFLDATGYEPKHPKNFLNHWHDDEIPEGRENHPVVWINLADARAYADWTQKRLPTEMEWQWAAQGESAQKWPWGVVMDSTRCNCTHPATTPVDSHPEGASPFGIQDLVGNVWQLTGDIYKNASYTYNIIRGGSYYKPTSSWWYVKGGPQPLDETQMLLHTGPGLNRNATVGFRLVKDVASP